MGEVIINRFDRPGLLLMCHGDFPGGFFEAEAHRELYRQCLYELGRLRHHANFYGPSPPDEFTRMGQCVAAHVSAGLGLESLELSYLSLKAPDVRKAVYKAAIKGPERIICAGAAGLMLPGHGVSECLASELRGVVVDNPALNLALAPSSVDAGEIAMLVRWSLEHAFQGSFGEAEAPARSGERLEDTAVVLVCSPDYAAASRAGAGAAGAYSGASAALSEASQTAYLAGGKGGLAEHLRAAAASSAGGFHAAEAGFIDFALPGIPEAAARLIDAGSTHIVATGLPALLHRHPYSLSGPSEAIERLRKAFPDTGIVYVEPDPGPIAGGIADILMARVLEAEKKGISFKEIFRGL